MRIELRSGHKLSPETLIVEKSFDSWADLCSYAGTPNNDSYSYLMDWLEENDFHTYVVRY